MSRLLLCAGFLPPLPQKSRPPLRQARSERWRSNADLGVPRLGCSLHLACCTQHGASVRMAKLPKPARLWRASSLLHQPWRIRGFRPRLRHWPLVLSGSCAPQWWRLVAVLLPAGVQGRQRRSAAPPAGWPSASACTSSPHPHRHRPAWSCPGGVLQCSSHVLCRHDRRQGRPNAPLKYSRCAWQAQPRTRRSAQPRQRASLPATIRCALAGCSWPRSPHPE